MAVGIRLTFEGGTAEQYDAVHQHLGIDSNPPAGLVFHCAGPAEGHWWVVDVWETREAFDAFVQGRLMPGFGELGDKAPQSPPQISEFAVHHYTNA